MENNFTTTDLIRFIYRETLPEEDRAIKNWIQKDEKALAEYNSLIEAVASLDIIGLEPSETSLSIVLNFSRHSVEEEFHA